MLSIITHKSQTSSVIPEQIADRSNSQRLGLNRSFGIDFNWNNIAIQPKLKINQPGDEYEQEADRIAAQVVSGTKTEPVQKNFIKRKPLAEKITSLKDLNLQRKCSKCEEEEEKMVQRKENSGTQIKVPSFFNDELNVSKRSGLPLDPATNEFMSSRFGIDFSHVQIHNDPNAVQLSRSINARAFTLGNDIFFNTGEYRPHTKEGKRLLAHELVHTRQQGNYFGDSEFIQRQIIVSPGFSQAQVIRQVICLTSLTDEMARETNRYLRTACDDGNYITSREGVNFIPEDRADAFGHCWIACQGTKSCGESGTRTFGIGREYFREAMKYLTLGIWGHNSFTEDVHNQDVGRTLATTNPDIDCFDQCYQASNNGLLLFHGNHTGDDALRPRVYNCTDITLDGNNFRRGWRSIPMEYLERY